MDKSKIFNWSSDEDDKTWDEWSPLSEAENQGGGLGHGKRFKNLVLVATIVTLIGLAALSVNQNFTRTIESAVNQTNQAVLSAHRLSQQAAAEGDIELFSQLLSLHDLQWHSDQRVIVRQGLFHDRAPLGLWLDRRLLGTTGDEDIWGEATINLSPGLDSAEVTTLLSYVTETPAGALESVTLERTDHYWETAAGWILAGPADEAAYWGETGSEEVGGILRLVYPARDREISQRLGVDIAAVLGHLCFRSTAIVCEPGKPFEVTFETNPTLLLRLGDSFFRPRFPFQFSRARNEGSDRRVRVPTPSLVGLPVDETGYQALLRGYGAWLVTVFIYQQSGPGGISNDDYLALLADSGLSPPPPLDHNPLLALQPPPIALPREKILLSCLTSTGQSERWLFDPHRERWSAPDLADSGLVESSSPSIGDFWSPNGEMMVTQFERDRLPEISLRNREGKVLLRLTRAEDPFWLDDQRLGFIHSRVLDAAGQQSGEESLVTESELVIMNLAQGGSSKAGIDVILDSSRLRRAVTLFPQPQRLRIDDVALHPQDPGRLFLLARAATGLHDVYLFSYDLQEGVIDFLHRWRDNGSDELPLHVGQSGRFLTVVRYNSYRSYISVYDVERDTRQMTVVDGRPFERFAWSADEGWLAIATDRLLWLMVPAYDYARTISHDVFGCRTVDWI